MTQDQRRRVASIVSSTMLVGAGVLVGVALFTSSAASTFGDAKMSIEDHRALAKTFWQMAEHYKGKDPFQYRVNRAAAVKHESEALKHKQEERRRLRGKIWWAA